MRQVKMHDDELDIGIALVRRLLAVQFPEWATLRLEPVLPRGTDNALYKLGEDMVVRLPRHKKSVAPLLKEWEWLPQLAPRLSLALPIPLAKGVPAAGYPLPWAVYRWLKGEMATVERIADPCQAATDLAQFMAALQSLDVAGPPPDSNSARGVPLAGRDAATRTAITTLQGEVDVDRVTAAWEEALFAPAWPGPSVWLHGDLDSRNLLVRNGRLTAVLDWGSASVGDPACDVMVAWKLFSGESRAVFRTQLAVDEATWIRSKGWALSQALLALAYYSMETNPTLVLEAQRWMAEVLADDGS